MIGGIDIRIPNRAGQESVEVAVRAIRQQWPSAVFENGNTAERYDSFWQIPFGDVEELFVYRDANSAELWDKHGAIPAAENSMVHILYDEGLITAVIDDRTAEMEDIIQSIRSALVDPLLTIPALLEAA
jgi:hypothetical protein